MNIDVLALTTPPGTLTGTRAGDIVFNANDLFTVNGNNPVAKALGSVYGIVQQDLYTVAVHEVGHALGLPDNTNPASVMYGSYRGAETGLFPADVTAIQALYGTPAQAPADSIDTHGAYAGFANALALQTTPGYTADTHYNVSAIQDSASNVDMYSFQSASVAAGQPNVMTIAVAVPAGGVLPSLSVFDNNQQPVAFQVLDNGYGYYSIQVPNALSGNTYYVAVAAGTGTQPGSSYKLDISFCSQTVSYTVDAQGTLSQFSTTALQLMTVSESDFRYFTLTATGGANSPAAWVKVTITNALLQVVGSLTAQAGQTVGGIVTLDAGVYVVTVTAGTSDGSSLQPIDYVLSSVTVSSPVGATATNPNQTATGSGNTTTQSSSSGSTSTPTSGSSTTQAPSSGSSSTAQTSYITSITGTPGGTVVVGSGAKLTDSATLSGGSNETGTITFTLYNSSNTVVDAETATVNGNGTCSTPNGYLPTATGTYQWVVTYSGDSKNTGVSSTKGSEPESVSAAGPSLTATPGGTVVVGSGARLTDFATLSGGYNETGAITFTLYNSSNTVVDTETATASGNGSYSTPNGYLPTAAGTYQWMISYSGDSNNNGISSAKGSTPVTVSAATPTLSGTAGGTVVAGSGAKMTNSVTLSGGYNETGTITFTLYNSSNTVVNTETVTVNGNGTYSTPNGYLPTTAGTYQWVVTYSGDSNNNSVSSSKGSEPETVSAKSTT